MSADLHFPSDQLAALRPDDIQLYLSSRGWQTDPEASSSKALLYHLPNVPDAEILLPKSKALADFKHRMADIVQMLAAVESRSVWEVLHDLSVPPGDLLRLQVSSSEATLGLLPLGDGIKLIEGGRALLLAAACSADHPQSYYPRQTYRKPTEFIETCQLGQTERGSFVASILAPVPQQIEFQQGLFKDESYVYENEPFARKTTWRLMEALGYLSEVIQQGRYQEILSGIPKGISANLCDAITQMQPTGDQATLSLHMTWSRNRFHIPKTIVPSVSFSQTEISIIQEAGRQLRKEPSIKDRKLSGVIVGLRAEMSVLDGFEGVTTIRTTIDGANARVQMALGKEDYQKACDAHRDNRHIEVSGLLQRESKMFRLRNPHNFQIIAENHGPTNGEQIDQTTSS